MANPSKSPAFTLIELLTVIVIVGILAALVLAAVIQAKAKAQQVQCANNVHQLGTGMQMFLGEKHFYPLLVDPIYQNGTLQGLLSSWRSDLQNELYARFQIRFKRSQPLQYPAEGIWHCPSAYRPIAYPAYEGYEDYGYNGYGMNTRTDTTSLGLGGHYVWNPPLVPALPISESEVVSPSEMMAIGDGFIGGDGVIHDGAWILWRTHRLTNFLGGTQRAYTRHQGRANVVFCDGHVESPTLQFLFADTSDTALVRWNRDHQPHREKLSP